MKLFINPATYEVETVTMRSKFYLDDNQEPVLCEYTLDKLEWRAYLKAHKLARWIPFTCAAFWMCHHLEDLVCGLTPERYKRIESK